MKMKLQANTSVKISGSEKKGEQEHVRDIASIKRVTRKKWTKSVLHVQRFFSAN